MAVPNVHPSCPRYFGRSISDHSLYSLSLCIIFKPTEIVNEVPHVLATFASTQKFHVINPAMSATFLHRASCKPRSLSHPSLPRLSPSTCRSPIRSLIPAENSHEAATPVPHTSLVIHHVSPPHPQTHSPVPPPL